MKISEFIYKYKDKDIPVHVRYSRQRNIYYRYRKDGFHVSAPYLTGQKTIFKGLEKFADKLIVQFEKMNSNYSFDYKPLTILGLLLGISWMSFFVSKYIIRRSNFELETLGIFLSGVGIINSAGADVKSTYTQIICLGIGIVFFEIILAFIKDPDIAMKFRPYIAVIALVLLAMNLVFGKVKNGSQNWVMFGPFSFQPSEIVKVAFVFFGSSTIKGIQTTNRRNKNLLFHSSIIKKRQ